MRASNALSAGRVSVWFYETSASYEGYKKHVKTKHFGDRAFVKTTISGANYTIFQTACVDFHLALASTLSIVNEWNRMTFMSA